MSAGGAFGKTPMFRKVWWLTIFLSFGLGLGIALAILMIFYSLPIALWGYCCSLLVGYTVAFNVRIHYLRPHIREYLANRENPVDRPI